jgi:hypothetical protein
MTTPLEDDGARLATLLADTCTVPRIHDALRAALRED